VITIIRFTLRFKELISWNWTNFDIIMLLIWISIILTPLFSDIEIFWLVKLKQEVEKLESNINKLENDIKLSQNQNVIIHQFLKPSSDEEINKLENKVKELTWKEVIDDSNLVSIGKKLTGRFDVPDDNLLLFKIRYKFEEMINDIRIKYFENRWKTNTIHGQILDLKNNEIINLDLYSILKEILAICNYWIHWKTVTEIQMDFIYKHGKEIYDYLSNLK